MRTLSHPRSTALLALMGFSGLFGASGCEPMNSGFQPDISPEQTECTSGQAQIEIGDGYQRILCGCAEAGGKVVPSGGAPNPAITCTVPEGTVVFFEYVNSENVHQIVSIGTPSFPSSPPSSPKAKPPFLVYGATFSPAGTYEYEDAFDPGATGHIVAQ